MYLTLHTVSFFAYAFSMADFMKLPIAGIRLFLTRLRHKQQNLTGELAINIPSNGFVKNS